MKRYTDTNVSVHRDEDFIARQRIPTSFQFIMLFAINLSVVMAAYVISTSFMGFAVTVFLMLALTDFIVVLSVQRSRDLVLVTEFQNSLFASALTLNTLFCLIIRGDGTIVYADRGFRTLYPHFDRISQRSIEDILRVTHMEKDDANRVLDMVGSMTPGMLVLSLRDGEGKTRRVMLNADPLRRPNDYVLLRARNYIEHRSG